MFGCKTNKRWCLPFMCAAIGSTFSVAAGRLSFTFGFKGPAVSIDTACSSSLVATHQAVLQLLSKPQKQALANGINMMFQDTATAAATAAGMLTYNGRCKTLDASADGYVRSEACTALLLTWGAEAGHSEAAYLCATSVNQDGRSSSLTAPNGPSQQAVIRGAIQAADLQPEDISALEMHGTGEAGVADLLTWHSHHNCTGHPYKQCVPILQALHLAILLSLGLLISAWEGRSPNALDSCQVSSGTQRASVRHSWLRPRSFHAGTQQHQRHHAPATFQPNAHQLGAVAYNCWPWRTLHFEARWPRAAGQYL